MTADPRACAGAEVLDVVSGRRAVPDGQNTVAESSTRPPPSWRLQAGLSVRVTKNTYTDHLGNARGRHCFVSTRDPVATAVSHSVRRRAHPRGNAPRPRRRHTGAHGGPGARLPGDGRRRRLARHVHPASATVSSSPTKLGALEDACVRCWTSWGSSYDGHFAISAKVTLVGAGMHGVPGVMARMVNLTSRCGRVRAVRLPTRTRRSLYS